MKARAPEANSITPGLRPTNWLPRPMKKGKIAIITVSVAIGIDC